MCDRYYSSELHRFLSLDKDQGDLYRPSTLNPYAYVGNDPINFIDPSGMTAVNLANALKNAVFNEDGSLNWGGLFELGKFALSFSPIDFFIDLYDLGQSILAFDWTWGGLADIGLNVVGFLPGIGDFAKASKLGKNAIKTVDAVADVTDGLNDARKAIKRTDALVDAGKAAKNVGNGAEAFADSSKAAKALNKGSDALDTANDAGKALKHADEAGGGLKTTKNLHKFKEGEDVIHYNKHKEEIMKALDKSDYSFEEYIDDANYVIKTGEYSSDAHAYYKLIGGTGRAKFAFVGLDRVTNEITTFHIKRVNELIKKAPNSGIAK